MDEPRKARRYRAELVLALVVVALLAAALLWRYAPPREGTMNGVRTAIASFRAAEAPTLPADAVRRGSLSAAEQQALASQVTAELQACCTSRYWREVQDDSRTWTGLRAEALRTGEEGPPTQPFRRVSDVVFERRTWGGALVVRLVLWDTTYSEPGTGGARSDEYVLRKVDGRWRIDDIVYHGD